MRDIPLDKLQFSDFQDMQHDAVRESRHLDYKWQLATNWNDTDKKEFLADVSSFANTGGSDIVWGIEEGKDTAGNNTGIISTLHGVPSTVLDLALQKLEGFLRTGMEPRIPGTRFHEVPGGPEGPLLVLRIPRSWIAPHMIRDTGRFWSRSSVGKQQLDVQQLRSAFLEADSAAQRVSKFRLDRVAKIVANETPVPTGDGPRWCMHVLPVGPPVEQADVVTSERLPDFRPIETNGHGTRHNIDGLLAHGGGSRMETMRSCFVTDRSRQSARHCAGRPRRDHVRDVRAP